MNTEATPQTFVWDGVHSVMIPERPKLCDRQYVDGEKYRLGITEERSTNSHNHYFAAINSAWNNLSDEQAMRFPSQEHLRKWALIQAGYFTISDFACANAEEARRLASFLRTHEPYIVTVIEGATVSRLEAMSQSTKSMDKKTFQESKTKVLDALAELIGTSRDALSKASAA